MGSYLDPGRLNARERQAVDQWLVANGSRRMVALEPVIIKGRHVEFTEFTYVMRDHWLKPGVRWSLDDRHELVTHRRRLRIRVPLASIREMI